VVEKLLISGICVIPFYEILIKLCPYAQTMTGDTREAKSFLALFFAISCFCLHLWNKGTVQCKSKVILSLVVYTFFVTHLWWKMPIALNDVMVGGFYKWQPLLYLLSFFVLFLTVSSIHLNKDKILSVIMWMSSIMACYVILQAIGLDQFFSIIKAGYTDSIGFTAKLAGNLGQPTLVSPFIALGVPIALYMKKPLNVVLMVVAVLLTQSMVANFAMIIGVGFYLLSSRHIIAKYFVIGSLVTVTLYCFIFKPSMTGREFIWPETVKDVMTTPFEEDNGQRFAFTGVGLGAFPMLYHLKHIHQTMFHQVHNEYLEWFYSTGLFGLILLLMSVTEIFKTSQDKTVTSVFLVLCICAAGTFIWQLGVYQYISTVIVGLIYGGKDEKISVSNFSVVR